MTTPVHSRSISLGLHGLAFHVNIAVQAAANLILDGPTERLAVSIRPAADLSVTAADLNLVVVGTVTGMTFTLEIQTDSSGAPSGTPVGTATSAFAGPAASGWIGEQTFGSAASLTANTVYWLVLACASGTPDASNSLHLRHIGAVNILAGENCRHHNGTNWTTTAAINVPGCAVLKDSDGQYHGWALTSGRNVGSAATDVFGNNWQGVKRRYGAPVIISGVVFRSTKTGAPNAMEIVVFEGSTQKAFGTIPAANIASDRTVHGYVSSPVQVAANTDVYVIMRQAAAGGTDAADYDIYTYDLNTTYRSALLPTNSVFCYGATATDPTSSPTELAGVLPLFEPLINNVETDLVSSGGGGAHPGTTFSQGLQRIGA